MPPAIRYQVMSSWGVAIASVVLIAIAMPIMPRRLPRRDVAGLESPLSAKINSTPETR